MVIRLDPHKLQNPDADLRYAIPDRLSEESPGLLAPDGYDYESGGAMQIYLSTPDVDAALPRVIALLATDGLADAARVGVSEADAVATTSFRVVWPPDANGFIVVP
jgi:hypothetical protein